MKILERRDALVPHDVERVREVTGTDGGARPGRFFEDLEELLRALECLGGAIEFDPSSQEVAIAEGDESGEALELPDEPEPLPKLATVPRCSARIS